jgi:lysophospholipase L1-like esterase
VLFLSLLNVVSKDNYKDGLHPNKEGDAEIAQAVSTFLITHE